MQPIVIVADAGSTHMGKRAYGEELIRVAQDAGCDAIKFQLFKGEEYTKAGNLELAHEMFRDFYNYGRTQKFPVTASAFDSAALEFLFGFQLHHIKFAYSQRHSAGIDGALATGRKVVVSTDVMDTRANHPNLTKLYVSKDNQVPLYPNHFLNNFEGLFPGRFQGFSDHSLGFLEAVKARDFGATWFECHMTLPYSDINVPDARFAKNPKELKEYCWKVKR